jgi:ABC-2 type transport system ATP-binding protein
VQVQAIEISGLRKSYRSARGVVNAVDGLDLAVGAGGVHGFLGANGAGKTTTIRALVGHLHATAGEIRLLGHSVPHDLPKVIDRVGALVEQPSFFPNFSGRRNLALLARSRGIPQTRVDAALDTVGLTDRAGSRFATYSLGMKQRLGVAAVLLKDPEVLILDEPANGLDPPGILEMRTLLRRLGEEGRTVFVSSHILSEVEQTCDRVSVIAHGRLVRSGTVRELMAGGESRFAVSVPGGSAELAAAAQARRRAGFDLEATGDGQLSVAVEGEAASQVTAALAASGIHLSLLMPIERTLEDAFLELTGTAPTEPAAPAPPQQSSEHKS